MLEIKSVLIVGMSKTGTAVLNFLKNKNVKIYVYDDNIDCKIFKNDSNVFVATIKDIKKDNIDYLIISPGIAKTNKIVQMARKVGIKIISEIEFAYMFCKSKNIVAITGTNGKTTVTELLFSVLSKKYKVYKCGNIGLPFISVVDKVQASDYVVIELSSFQLEDIVNFKPFISIILNLEPDHLNRYESEKEYYLAKLKIIKNQNKNDYCIINSDDENIHELLKAPKSKLLSFSIKDEKATCYYCESKNSITYLVNHSIYNIDEDKLKLKGLHNYKNIMVAILVANLVNIDKKNLINALYDFSPLSHRLEIVKSKGHITFINDSKATNVGATISALNSFKCSKILLLLGGSDKGEDFKPLFKNLNENVRSYIYGETKLKMIKCAEDVGYVNYKVYNTLKIALDNLLNDINDKSIVLLSPACASFDEFKSYEERGNYFKQWVLKNV